MERTKRRAVMSALVLVACVGCGQSSVTPTAQSLPPVTMEVKPAQPVKKTYTREELAKLLQGKTEAEITAAIGRPIQTTGSGPDASWLYDGLTTDTVTGVVDRHTWVVFRNRTFHRIHH